MIRRPPRSTLFPYHDALPICLLIRSFANVMRLDPGFEAANLLASIISLPPSRYPDEEQQARFFEEAVRRIQADRKSTRLNSSHLVISYAVFCLKKKKNYPTTLWFALSQLTSDSTPPQYRCRATFGRTIHFTLSLL